MKRGVIVALLALAGCASGNVRLFQSDPTPRGCDQDTVQSLVCAGEPRSALNDPWLYLERCGANAAESTERIERAKKHCDCFPSCEAKTPAAAPAGGVR